jgi:hypothetical protein
MKTKHSAILVILATVIISGLSSCVFDCVHGSGSQATENRKLTDFSRIDISGGFKVILKQDSSLSLKITADDNLLKYIKTAVNGGKLRIYTRRNICNSGEMTLNIGVRNLEEIKASGGIEVLGDGKITTQDMHFRLSGATKVTMELNAANVTTTGRGSTELNLKGQATSHNIEMSGSSKVNALDFVVGNCDIQTSGVGDSKVNVLHALNINSAGASDVKYRGNPSVTEHKAGASSVEKIN